VCSSAFFVFFYGKLKNSKSPVLGKIFIQGFFSLKLKVSSTGKKFFVQTQSLQYRGKFPIGIFFTQTQFPVQGNNFSFKTQSLQHRENPYRDLFAQTQKSPAQGKIPIGIFRSNSKSPVQGKIPRFFHSNPKSPVQGENAKKT